jgi:hypothetical protein
MMKQVKMTYKNEAGTPFQNHKYRYYNAMFSNHLFISLLVTGSQLKNNYSFNTTNIHIMYIKCFLYNIKLQRVMVTTYSIKTAALFP